MGWYKYRLSSKIQSTYESKIVYMDAERIARKRLFYRGNSSPDEKYLKQIVSNVVENLIKKYGSIDKIRLSSTQNSLSDIIEIAVEEELP